jgi:GTP-binding protein
MEIKSAKFIKSSDKLSACPGDGLPEFAFIGRSNVGKSSLINLLTGRRKLAKTSSTPGKTRLINHFLINENWYLVDLPGYGYAKVSKKEHSNFGALIESYVLQRKNLLNLFVLVDANVPAQQIDIDFTTWLGLKSIPFSIVYTKTDKPNQKNLNSNLNRFRERMHENWEELPPEFLTSAAKKTGKDEVLDYIDQILA